MEQGSVGGAAVMGRDFSRPHDLAATVLRTCGPVRRRLQCSAASIAPFDIES
jgi:hypothetical protein